MLQNKHLWKCSIKPFLFRSFMGSMADAGLTVGEDKDDKWDTGKLEIHLKLFFSIRFITLSVLLCLKSGEIIFLAGPDKVFPAIFPDQDQMQPFQMTPQVQQGLLFYFLLGNF